MSPLESITQRVTRLGHPDDEATPRPLVTIEEFFEGNYEVGSIGCNLESTPAPSEFYELFRKISENPKVKDIRVQITLFDTPEWPFSDTVYIMTSATSEEVASWFPNELKPDETWDGFVEQIYEPYQIPDGVKVVGCWWD